MIPWYVSLISFSAGVFIGFLLMGLMVANSDKDDR